MVAVFDPTKNYAEFGNAFFRGRLKGATGEARFKLIATTINAIDTVNIRNGAVTYNFYQRYETYDNIQSTTPIYMPLEVLDDGVYLEFIAYGHGCTGIVIDGVVRPRYNGKGVDHTCLPHNEILPMTKGVHTAYLAHPGNVKSNDGYIFVRYIRPTGLGG